MIRLPQGQDGIVKTFTKLAATQPQAAVEAIDYYQQHLEELQGICNAWQRDLLATILKALDNARTLAEKQLEWEKEDNGRGSIFRTRNRRTPLRASYHPDRRSGD